MDDIIEPKKSKPKGLTPCQKKQQAYSRARLRYYIKNVRPLIPKKDRKKGRPS